MELPELPRSIFEVGPMQEGPAMIRAYTADQMRAYATTAVLAERERLCAEVPTILHGIALDECESQNGWWETSTGSEFGQRKLAELLAAIRNSPYPATKGEEK